VYEEKKERYEEQVEAYHEMVEDCGACTCACAIEGKDIEDLDGGKTPTTTKK
jgi:hypothetical protein